MSLLCWRTSSAHNLPTTLSPPRSTSPPLPRTGTTYPLNKVSAARRLVSFIYAKPSADKPALVAGMTGTDGEDFTELLR